MANAVSVSAQIPVELSDMLDEVARTEERSKSYYIKKGLESFLGQRLQALQLERNMALSLQQIEAGNCHEVNDEFWQSLKDETASEINAKAQN